MPCEHAWTVEAPQTEQSSNPELEHLEELKRLVPTN
jgi:hypothetical protein